MKKGKGFSVTINHKAMRQLNKAAQTALAKTAEAIHTEVVQAQVVPRDTGRLQNTAFFVDTSEVGRGKAFLIHSTPYARRLYYHPEYHFHQSPWETIHQDGSVTKHEGNANAKGRWFDDWLPGGKNQNFAAKAFAKFYERASNGVIE